jgi:hypothetical protein
MKSEPRRVARWALLASIALAAGPLAAQEDLALPPRVEDAPGAARLAAEPPDRREPLEEIVVVSEQRWRLPDLGSEWRAEHAAEADSTARIEATFMPLYDPENDAPTYDVFNVNRAIRQVGFIELFRVRFGQRSPEREPQ